MLGAVGQVGNRNPLAAPTRQDGDSLALPIRTELFEPSLLVGGVFGAHRVSPRRCTTGDVVTWRPLVGHGGWLTRFALLAGRNGRRSCGNPRIVRPIT